jgi:chromosome segregation ATPase
VRLSKTLNGKTFHSLVALAAVLGLLTSLGGQFWLFTGYPAARASALSLMDSGVSSLAALHAGLRASQDSLAHASLALGDAADTAGAMQGTLNEVANSLTALDQLTGEQLPAVLEDTTASLETTQQSAHAIEQVLYALNTVSFLTGINYNPPVTLERRLGEVAASLSPIQSSLSELNDGLVGLDDELGAARDSITALTGNLEALQTDLDEAATHLTATGDHIAVLETTLGDARIQMARGLTTLRWIGHLILGLAFIYQLAWLGQALERRAL